MTTGKFVRKKGKGSLDWPPAIQTGEQQLEVSGNSELLLLAGPKSKGKHASIWITI